MSNTILSSKNTFEGGLVMDFSPSNSRSNTLSSALNATFITLNGNELQLLNDMGNGRVETARLPEGYIPVGTCEFGDIIYIVSYNPLTNKSLIGCFPSPERNISSKEISDIEQVLSYTDFQEIDKDGNLTGNLKNTTVKKVLIETKKLNPGDKYIVYTDDPDNIIENANFLSDWGKGEHGIDPKYLKLHIVSIEDLGKITYLDTTTKWYDIENTIGSFLDYYISAIKNNTSGETEDLDSYRNTIESNWSIFNSKVSGKLAILAELENIDSFSCSYELELSGIISVKNGNHTREYKCYGLYLYPEHTSRHDNIKPSSICASKSSFTPDSCKVSYIGYKLNNDIIIKDSIEEDAIFEDNFGKTFKESLNSGWKYSTGCIDTGIIFKIPHKDIINNEEFKISSESFIYNLEIIPCMEYGRLDQFKQTITIDFNKIGSGEVELSTWKYHNTEEQSVITFGVNYYPQPQHEIKAIIIDFYDNLGICTEYRLLGRKSYNGTFTEYLQLGTLYENVNNSKFYSSKLKDYQTSKKVLSELEADEITHYTDASFSDGVWSSGKVKDVNVIYPNFLYGVKIRILTAREDNEEFKQEHVFYRWFWTTTMYNDYYYQYDDFDILGFNLELTGEILFASKDNFNWNEQTINNLTYSADKDKSYSANVYTIGEDDQSNLKMSIYAGLTNNYGCFNLYHRPEITDGVYKALVGDTIEWLTVEDGKISEDNNSYTIEEFKNLHKNYIYSFGNPLNNVNVDIYLGDGKIIYDNLDYIWSDSELDITQLNFIKKDYLETTKFNDLESSGGLSNYTLGLYDKFSLTFYEGGIEDSGYYKNSMKLVDCIYPQIDDTKYVDLSFRAQLFNKAYVESTINKTIEGPIYKPIINSFSDLAPLGIKYYEDGTYTRLYFSLGITLGNKSDNTVSMTSLNFIVDDLRPYPYTEKAIKSDSNNTINITDQVSNMTILKLWEECTPLGLFFLLYPCANVTSTNQPSKYIETPIDLNTLYWDLSHFERIGTRARFYGYGSYNYRNILTTNLFAITADGSIETKDNSMTPMLAVKTDENFTVLNSAYNSKYNEKDNTVLTQLAANNSNINHLIPYVDTFAAQICLLLTHTYNKNCIDDTINSLYAKPIIVSNDKFKATISENILVKFLSGDEINNILFHGMDFNYYTYTILENLDFYLNYNNVNCKFIDSAIQTSLTIEKETDPLILDLEVKGFYKTTDGNIHLLNVDMEPDTFYIIQNNGLRKYEDYKTYIFPIQSNFLGKAPLYLQPSGRNSENTIRHELILKDYRESLPEVIIIPAQSRGPDVEVNEYFSNTKFKDEFYNDNIIYPIKARHFYGLEDAYIAHNISSSMAASLYSCSFNKKPIYDEDSTIVLNSQSGDITLFGYDIKVPDYQRELLDDGYMLCRIPFGKNYRPSFSVNYKITIEPTIEDSTIQYLEFKYNNEETECQLLNDFIITVIFEENYRGSLNAQTINRVDYKTYVDPYIIEKGKIKKSTFYVKYPDQNIYRGVYYFNANDIYESDLENKATHYILCNLNPVLNTTVEYTHNILQCGLGLNKWFYYDDNTLKAHNPPLINSIKYKTSDAEYYISTGTLDYYIDEDFKINRNSVVKWGF